MKHVDLRLQYITIGYLILPVLIFFLGWLNLVFGLLFSGLLLFGCLLFVRRLNRDAYTDEGHVGWQGLVVVGLAFGWVALSGVGSFANQDWDHHFRNAIFRDLVRHDWPIYYSFAPTYKLDILAGQQLAFNYYFSFWLPAALIGKLGGHLVGNAALLLWSYGGILLILYHLNRLLGFRYVLAASLLFMLWSGLDLFGKVLLQKHVPTYDEPIELYAPYFYTAFTTDMYNVFNQAIPAWLVTLLVLNYWRQVPVLPVFLLIAYAPFPFIGLALFFAIYYAGGQLAAGESLVGLIRQAISDVFRIDNLLVLTAVMVPYTLFYGAHTGNVPSSFFWTRFFKNDLVEDAKTVAIYGITYLLEVGVFLGLIYLISPATYRSNTRLFWLCAGLLLVLPIWVLGLFNDFASRGSIPALTVLCVLTIRALIDWADNRQTGYRRWLPLLVIGMTWVTPLLAVLRGIPFGGTPRLRENLITFANPAITKDNDPQGMYPNLGFYYSYNPRQHFFYRYLVRK